MKITLLQIVGLVACAGLLAAMFACSRQTTLAIKDSNMNTEKAAFAAGCFWACRKLSARLPA